jgi:hypothetical protein
VVHAAHSAHVAPPPFTVAVTSFVVETPRIQTLPGTVGIIVPALESHDEAPLAQYVIALSWTYVHVRA